MIHTLDSGDWAVTFTAIGCAGGVVVLLALLTTLWRGRGKKK